MKYPTVILFDDEYTRMEFMKWFDNKGTDLFMNNYEGPLFIDCDYYTHVIDVVDPYKDKDE